MGLACPQSSAYIVVLGCLGFHAIAVRFFNRTVKEFTLQSLVLLTSLYFTLFFVFFYSPHAPNVVHLTFLLTFYQSKFVNVFLLLNSSNCLTFIYFGPVCKYPCKHQGLTEWVVPNFSCLSVSIIFTLRRFPFVLKQCMF